MVQTDMSHGPDCGSTSNKGLATGFHSFPPLFHKLPVAHISRKETSMDFDEIRQLRGLSDAHVSLSRGSSCARHTGRLYGHYEWNK